MADLAVRSSPILETEPEPGAEEQPAREWGLAKRLLFRFGFLYFVLYCFPFPLNVVPHAEVLVKPYQSLWNALVSTVGWMAFKVDAEDRLNGSGDTTFDWVRVLTILVLAVLGTAVWTWLGRRKEHARLYDGLRVYVRAFLAIFMLSYGASKAIKAQFAFPGLDQMLEPIGDMSPMGIVWNFMGASTAYTAFTGLVEMLGGFLVAFRRTTLLGALVSLGAMANVLMLNLCYDVPVKLFSFHLLLMAVFLALPDVQRLADLFLFNRRVERRAEDRPLFANPRTERWASLAGIAAVLLFAGWSLYGAWQDDRQYGDLREKPPLYGIWRADEVTVDGVVRPPLITDGARWRYLVFDYPGEMGIYSMNDSSGKRLQYYRIALDEKKRTITLRLYKNPRWRAVFAWKQPAPGVLDMEGTLDGQRIRARLRRLDESRFMLVSRGFHWVSEYPMNH